MAKRILILYNKIDDIVKVYTKLNELYNANKSILNVSLSTLQHFDFNIKNFENSNCTISKFLIEKAPK